jgi:hypothetical protein
VLRFKIVPKTSAAVPGSVNVEAVGLNRDHKTIVKFTGTDDPEYERVRAYLEIFLGQEQTQKVTQRWEAWDPQSRSP